jgi:hypothetical protein
MAELKVKWAQQNRPVQFAVVGVVVVLGLIFMLKLLPALVGAMGIGLVLLILFAPYWLPTIIAFVRKHPSKGGILVLNLFVGWTFVGWVVSLAWALSDPSASGSQQTVIVNNVVSAGAPPMPTQYQAGDVMNGHRFDGATWIPLNGSLPPIPRQYQAGDVVNGHRFDGATWIPLNASPEPPRRPSR